MVEKLKTSPHATANTVISGQYLKACPSLNVNAPNVNCPNDINSNDNSVCAKVALVPSLLLHSRGSQGGGEASQPRLVCANLRPPYYVGVLARKLLNFKQKPKYTYEPRPDIITTDRIRRMLGFKRKSKKVHNVIREAIQWGVLSPALKKNGKIWTGHYTVNWPAVEVVANLIAQNVGDRPLNGLHYDKRQWAEFKQTDEDINEFWAFVRATRVQAFELAQIVLSPDNVLSPPITLPPIPTNGRLQYTLLELAGKLVWAVVLGLGNIYLVPAGIRGGAQSCFPCIAYGNGKLLCAGSIQALLRLLGLPDLASLLSLPEPFPYGGHSPRLVVDTGRSGLAPFDSFTPTSNRYEVGLQLQDSALLHCLGTRWKGLAIASNGMSPFNGWPALILVPASGTNRLVSQRPDIIKRDMLLCIDALRGLIHSAVRELRGKGLSPQSSVSYALALARSVVVQAQDPPIDTYIVSLDGLKAKDGKNSYRHESALTLMSYWQFVKAITSRSEPVRLKSFLSEVPLADTPYLKEVMDFGFFYAYNNQAKDKPNEVRVEWRQHSGVTESQGKEGSMRLALGALYLLEPALASTYQDLVSTYHALVGA
jgi:hypothetical protein